MSNPADRRATEPRTEADLLTRAIQLIQSAGINGTDWGYWRKDADEWLVKARTARGYIEAEAAQGKETGARRNRP